jgi:hypothetical protein
METQPNNREVIATTTEIKTSHSVVGCLSAIFGVFALLGAILFIYLMTSDMAGAGLDILGMFSAGITVICTLPALILGIIGLFLKNRKKLFPIIGVSISGLFVLIVVTGFFFISYYERLSSGKLPIRDGFTFQVWGTGANQNYSIDYYKNTLQFIIPIKNQRFWSHPKDINYGTAQTYNSLHIEVTAITSSTNTDTAFGIICDRGSNFNDDSYYYLVITRAGKYVIAKVETGKKDVILTNNGQWATSSLITQNAKSYRIGADCSNGTLTLYVDGQQIDSVYDASYPNGWFALFVMSGNNEGSSIVGFDDFLAKEK